MTEEQAILATLVAYKIVLLGIGWWAGRRTEDGTDFFLGGRQLGAFVAALSASASSSSAWTLLGVSGAAYAWGLGAVWLFPACVGGFLINWFFLAPRLRELSHAQGSLTVTDFLAGPPGTPYRQTIGRMATFIIVLSLATYVATQFQGAGKTFSEVFDLSMAESIWLGAAVVALYTLMGGFWAVSLTDTLQGFLMALTALILPLAALVAVGGASGLIERMAAVEVEGFLSWTRGYQTASAIGFVVGLLGIGLGYPGQPHVANRFMALRDHQSVLVGRWVAIVWGVIVYSGMLVVGWCGRVLTVVDDKEKVFIGLTSDLFPPVVAGIMIAAVLSAIMSTADSQLLVVVSSITHDFNLERQEQGNLIQSSRWVILTVTLVAILAAIYGPPEIFSFVLFAWSALGSAFGPLLLVRCLGGPIRPAFTLAAMATGFTLSVTGYWFGSGVMERVFPFFVALVIAQAGRQPQPVGSSR